MSNCLSDTHVLIKVTWKLKVSVRLLAIKVGNMLRLAFFFHVTVSFCSYALFDTDGRQVPQELVTKVGEVFESILKEASFLIF